MPDPKRPSANEVREFVINNVEAHPNDIVKQVRERFGISRQSANNHLRKLVKEEVLDATGRTKARKYKLHNFIDTYFDEVVSDSLQEDTEWRNKVLPLMENVPDNIIDICQYGFTEMVNNVIDHSGSDRLIIHVWRNILCIKMVIWDFGVGIFNKIQKDFALDDPRHALLELSKGKLTSDPKTHTGEGIFFTSRMFDDFSIYSGTLFFYSFQRENDWLLEVENKDKQRRGTAITMEISIRAKHTLREIFERYQDDNLRFNRTHVALELAKYEGEQLMSRSQAKRLLARVDQFSEVVLDFRGISTIGQAFADEIFRVYKTEHPYVNIVPIFTIPEVRQMIDRIPAENIRADEAQKSLNI